MRSLDFRVNNFDFIRLLAALQVTFIHSIYHLNIPVSKYIVDFINIFPGVPVLFFISGFLISASFEKSDGSIRDYFLNRALRIYPALWFCFAVSLSTVFVLYEPIFDLKNFLLWCVAQLSFFQFYNLEFLRGYGVGVLNGSLWTISVELQFYIAIPFLYFIARKLSNNIDSVKNLYLLLVIVFFVLVFANDVYQEKDFSDKSLLSKLYAVSMIPHLYMFLFGMVIQRNLDNFFHLIENKCLFWFLNYVFLSFSLKYFGVVVAGNYINFISFLFLSIFVVSFSYSFNAALGKLLHRKDISYGIYLYHMIIINVFVEKGYVGSYLFLLLVFLLTIVIAIFSWVCIEKPLLKLKKYSLIKD